VLASSVLNCCYHSFQCHRSTSHHTEHYTDFLNRKSDRPDRIFPEPKGTFPKTARMFLTPNRMCKKHARNSDRYNRMFIRTNGTFPGPNGNSDRPNRMFPGLNGTFPGHYQMFPIPKRISDSPERISHRDDGTSVRPNRKSDRQDRTFSSINYQFLSLRIYTNLIK